MSDNILSGEKQASVEDHREAPNSANNRSACYMEGTRRFKGGLAMAICCAAPLLVIAAITLFGISLGALASGFLTIAALLACPVGMYLMMRMMMKDKKSARP